jgi:hypothetical protein
MDNVIITVSNPLLYLKFAKIVDFKLFSSHTHTYTQEHAKLAVRGGDAYSLIGILA